LISDRRRHAPSGARGGDAGASGRNAINGRVVPGKVTAELERGDLIRIETPGGGGYGFPVDKPGRTDEGA
jgi:N-methylhydantoinase B